jgi:hypothetical protein
MDDATHDLAHHLLISPLDFADAAGTGWQARHNPADEQLGDAPDLLYIHPDGHTAIALTAPADGWFRLYSHAAIGTPHPLTGHPTNPTVIPIQDARRAGTLLTQITAHIPHPRTAAA